MVATSRFLIDLWAVLVVACLALGACDSRESAQPDPAADPGVAVTAVVRGVDASGRTLTLEHPAIEALGMPAMTMPFALGPGVDVAGLAPGQVVQVRIARSSRGLHVIGVEETRPP